MRSTEVADNLILLVGRPSCSIGTVHRICTLLGWHCTQCTSPHVSLLLPLNYYSYERVRCVQRVIDVIRHMLCMFDSNGSPTLTGLDTGRHPKTDCTASLRKIPRMHINYIENHIKAASFKTECVVLCFKRPFATR